MFLVVNVGTGGMEATPQEVLIAFLLPIVGFAILFIRFYFFGENAEEYQGRVRTKLRADKNRIIIRNVLEQYFPYYQDLNDDLKKQFIRRVEIFVDIKQVIGRNFKITADLRVLIAACAAQLTFGLKNFGLLSFRRILIYSDTYYSHIRKSYHKGEVNLPKRLIVLSATNLLKGIADPDDGINLGIHEMAHALNLDKILRNDDASFIYNLDDWEPIAQLELQNIKKNPNHFMRQYATTNIHEMFAVSTEYFFERPEEFLQKMPELYARMQKIYRQNPANHSNPLKLTN